MTRNQSKPAYVVVSFNGASVLCLDSPALRHAARDFASVRNAQPAEIAKLKPYRTDKVVARLYQRRSEWNAYMRGENDLKEWAAIVAKNQSQAHANMLKLTR